MFKNVLRIEIIKEIRFDIFYFYLSLFIFLFKYFYFFYLLLYINKKKTIFRPHGRGVMVPYYFCCILIQENKTWHKVLRTLY